MRATSLLTAVPSLGEVVLAPSTPTGLAQADLARSMADYLRQAGPDSGAEALSLLRRMFPDTPLTDRVAALAAAMRR